MLDISELLNKKRIAEKCAKYLETDNNSDSKFHRGYAQALREIISDMSPLTLVQDDIAHEKSEYQIAIIVTPDNSVATSVAVLNQDGELGMEYPYSGKHVYRDANNNHWIEYDGEVLPFNIELLEIIKES